MTPEYAVEREAAFRGVACPWNDGTIELSMITGLTPGRYANRSGEYEVRVDGTIWLIGGQDLPEGTERKRVDALPPDAAMTHAAMDAPTSGGSTPPGRGPDAEERSAGTEKKTDSE